jgi:hypothetical protein
LLGFGHVVILAGLLTPSGKIQKFLLRDRFVAAVNPPAG